MSSGTFVRETSKRASWRLVPSFTEQIKEAREAANASKVAGTEEAPPTNQGNEDQVLETGQTEQDTEQISFKSDDNHMHTESTTSDRNVTLVEEDVDDDDSTVGESVTMTFTIGSRGNQEAANTDDEHKLQGQGKETLVENMTSSASVSIQEETKDKKTHASEEDIHLETSMDIDIDQPTTPILTQ